MQKKSIILIKNFIYKIPDIIFYTKSTIWVKRDLKVNITKVTPKKNVEISFDKKNETLDWIKSLSIPELMNCKDRKLSNKEGHFLGCAKHNGKIIGSIRIGFNKVYIPDFKRIIKFKKDTGYITDIHIDKKYRGNGIAPFLIYKACLYLKDLGYSKQLEFNEFWNQSAQTMSLKVKPSIKKKVRYFRIFGVGFFDNKPNKL